MTESASPHWCKSLLSVNATVQEVIRNLDESGLQIALIVSDGRVLAGTVTDGDVRRALLRGLDLKSRIAEVMSSTPMVVPPDMGREMVLNLMRANKIRQLPVVDGDRRVVGLHVWDEVIAPSNRENVVVIMAGGVGRRLRPLTEDCPKPMLPVAGRPMLEHIIERAKGDGFTRFVISVGYLGQMIEDYFSDGSRFSVNITYLREAMPLGTAGALSLLGAAPQLPFLVTNGDVLTDIRYGEMLDFHVQHDAVATMAVRQHEWQHPFGVVHTSGLNIVGFEEKPVHRSHVNAGIYVLEPRALALLNSGEACDMPALFDRLQHDGRPTIAYPMHEPWLDVGRPEDLRVANAAKTSVTE